MRWLPVLSFVVFLLVIGCGGVGGSKDTGSGGLTNGTNTGGGTNTSTGGTGTGGDTTATAGTDGGTTTTAGTTSTTTAGTDGSTTTTTGVTNGSTSAGTDGSTTTTTGVTNGSTTAGTDGSTTTTGVTNGSTTAGTDGSTGSTTTTTDGSTTTGVTNGSTSAGTDGSTGSTTTTTDGSTTGSNTTGSTGSTGTTGTTGSTDGSTTGGSSGSTTGGGFPDLGDNADMNGARAFPDDNPWNTPIDAEPLDPNSANLIASIGVNGEFHPDFGANWDGGPFGIPYVVVTGNQAKSTVIFDYADESDAGPYPIPAVPPIEKGNDRHILMIDRDNWKLYELFGARKVGGHWEAGSGAIWNLNSNNLRPLFWTSADAAGLPIFPGLVRIDEVERGEIAHALRFTAEVTRRAFVYPARHYASDETSSNLPPMGMRVRLKANFNIAGYSQHNQVILRALKRYGMILADNGSNWFVSGMPDSRWNDEELSQLKQLRGRDFEVVKMGQINGGGRFGRR